MTTPTDEYVSVADVAHMTTLAASTLRTWRSEGRGPRSSKLGRRVVYRLADVQAWIAAQEAATARGESS